MIPQPRFSEADANAAWDEFRFNCGPSAVAVMTGLSIPELKPHLGNFPSKGYTNPMLMWEILNSIGVQWKARSVREVLASPHGAWPQYGLARIQWHGPWMKPGVPIAARYRHTHWVGTMEVYGDRGIFDINAINSGGWVSLKDWESTLVPHILKNCEPKATGEWSITHSVELATSKQEVSG